MIVDSSASGVVYSNLFTGVHGNYLRGSIVAVGLDPDNLPEPDSSAMNFGSGGNTDAKAWTDIWGAGQGVGVIKQRLSVAELVDLLKAQYDEAREDLSRRLLADEAPAGLRPEVAAVGSHPAWRPGEKSPSRFAEFSREWRTRFRVQGP